MISHLVGYFQRAFRWDPGRQGSGYDKMLLLTAPWPIAFDSYLIRYPVGSHNRCEHSVTEVTGSRRYVLSVGWLWGRDDG